MEHKRRFERDQNDDKWPQVRKALVCGNIGHHAAMASATPNWQQPTPPFDWHVPSQLVLCGSQRHGAARLRLFFKDTDCSFVMDFPSAANKWATKETPKMQFHWGLF